MCGIVGAVAQRNITPILVEGLKRLEYRGYDSCGVALHVDGKLQRSRSTSRVADLEAQIKQAELSGFTGIAHTRWATHGSPVTHNAHPHFSRERIALVHNGIIENHDELRAELKAAGYIFESQTDTEVIAHLVTDEMKNGKTPVEAVEAALPRLRGAFALAFLFTGEEDLLIGARRGSPLAIGYGDGEMYLGSDAIALAPFTDAISYLEDGDWAVLTRHGADVFDAKGSKVERAVLKS
ncbi:MAG: glutamine--fructose-6-phosphate transaminase (isomerizing), partial [Burkholderiaceae bacterium]